MVYYLCIHNLPFQLFSKELRKRHFQMLTNIRSAAGRRSALSGRATPARSGAMTPTQYSSGPSRAMSQASGPPRGPPSGPPSAGPYGPPPQHYAQVHPGGPPGKF